MNTGRVFIVSNFVNTVLLDIEISRHLSYPDKKVIRQCLYYDSFRRTRGGSTLMGLGSAFLFNCCGSTDIQNVGWIFSSEKEKQNFVYVLFHSLTTGQTYYFIANSMQLNEGEKSQFGNVTGLLRELGAKEVDDSKNRNHGPNKMHLHVWSPSLRSNEAWRKYLHFYSTNRTNPLWFHNLTDSEQVRLLEESKGKEQELATSKKMELERTTRQKLEDNKYTARIIVKGGHLDDYLRQLGWTKPGVTTNEPTQSIGKTVPTSNPFGSTIDFKW